MLAKFNEVNELTKLIGNINDYQCFSRRLPQP